MASTDTLNMKETLEKANESDCKVKGKEKSGGKVASTPAIPNSQKKGASRSEGGDEKFVSVPTTTAVVPATTPEVTEATAPMIPESPKMYVGRWSPEEKLLFLHGLKLYGRGNWKRIRAFLPRRSLVQIKSHGQKVLKRVDAGEDIWAPLRESSNLVQRLVAKQINTPGFILPRIPARASISRSLPKTRLKPRPVLPFDARETSDTAQFSVGSGRRETEATSPAVFKTMIGTGSTNLSFSFRGAPGQVEKVEPTPTHTFEASKCQTPPRPEPNMIKPATVMAATALCQLSVGIDAKKSSSASDDQTQARANLVSP